MNAQDLNDKAVPLNTQQQAIVKISATTAVGNLEGLKPALNAGLDSGLTINQIKDVLVQLYAYCGFPRSLNGISTFMKVLDERKAKGIADQEGKDATVVSDSISKYQTGKQNLQKLTGKEERVLTGANAFAPAIDVFLKEHLFADIFSRDVLTFQQRELATISALAAMSGVEPQLQAHLTMAMNTGLTISQLQGMIALIEKQVGTQQSETATRILLKITNQE